MNYTITEVQELHNQKERRYAIKCHINGKKLDIIKNIISDVNSDFLKTHSDVDVVYIYIGYDLFDAVHHNWIYTTEYRDKKLNISENTSYEIIREGILKNTDETNSVINDLERHYRDLESVLIKVKSKFDDMISNKLSEEEYFKVTNEHRKYAQDLFVDLTDMKFATIQYVDIQKNYLNAITDIVNVIELFTDKTVDKKCAIYVYENYKKKYNKKN